MRNSTKAFVIAGLVVGLAVALIVSPFASGSPDGLEKVAAEEGFDVAAMDHHLAEGPLADYAVDGIDSERLSTGLSGIIGVTATFAVGLTLFVGLRLLRSRSGHGGRAGDARTPG